MSNVAELGQAISDLVTGAAAKDQIINVADAARQLTIQFPKGGMSTDQIIAQIEHAAAITGAGMFLAGTRKAG